MLIDEWKFDYESLPRWNNRKEIAWVTDDLFECKTSDTACIIYSIAEVRMGSYIGFLAILKNKSNPKLYLNISNFSFPKQTITYNTKGNLIFVQTGLYNSESNHVDHPLLIIDIEKNSFAYFVTNNYNPFYTLYEKTEKVFKIKADEYQRKHDKYLRAFSRKKINLNKLKWYDIKIISDFSKMYFEQNTIN